MTISFTPWTPAKHPQPKGGAKAGRTDTPRTPRCRTRRGHREHTALPGRSPLPHIPWKKKKPSCPPSPTFYRFLTSTSATAGGNIPVLPRRDPPDRSDLRALVNPGSTARCRGSDPRSLLWDSPRHA